MSKTPERVKLDRQIDRIVRRPRYPVKDVGELVAQLQDEEFEFYEARVGVSKIFADKYLMSFITDQDFPMRNVNDLRRKLFTAYWRIARQELRSLKGVRIKMRGDRGMKPIEAVALKVLARRRLYSEPGSDQHA